MTQQTYGLEHFAFTSLGNIHRNLPVEELVEHELKNAEGKIGPNGALMVNTGEYPERLPDIKFIVDEPSTTDDVWWGAGERKITPENYDRLQARIFTFLSGVDLYITDGYYGADKQYSIPVRIVSKKAWHAHFSDNLLNPLAAEEMGSFTPEITIFNACDYQEHEFDKVGLNRKEFILINLESKIMILGGTENSEEMKKGLFSMANYLLPQKGVLSLHCAANIGKENDVALFLGCDGTGKTALVTDPNKRSWHRQLIGDDAHGWSENGIFNLENGCYATCYNIDSKLEPDIHQAIRFGAILENAVYDEHRKVDYSDDSRTENIRVSYPIDFIHNAVNPGVGGHPQNLVLLAKDMYGVLPPIARLTPDQAVYYFLNGYSSRNKSDSTEIEIEPLFSFCFGAPFLTQRPNVYAELLTQKIERHGITSYLLNTGWVGGPAGVGKRVVITDTRKIIDAILDDSVKNSIFEKDPIFGYEIPKQLTGVDSKLLHPKSLWKNPAEYDEARKILAQLFVDNFESYAQAGPQTGDVVAVKYLYNEYNRLSSAGPHL